MNTLGGVVACGRRANCFPAPNSGMLEISRKNLLLVLIFCPKMQNLERKTPFWENFAEILTAYNLLCQKCTKTFNNCNLLACLLFQPMTAVNICVCFIRYSVTCHCRCVVLIGTNEICCQKFHFSSIWNHQFCPNF